MSEPARAEIEVEVRYAETDQMGVVHHANYPVWFELARTALCRRSGFDYATIEENGHLLMVTRCAVEYRAGARYGDTVTVNACIRRMQSRTINFEYEVWREEELLATGSTDHVWISRSTSRPCRIPEYLREPFSQLAGC